jgi:hypothetical protein
MCGEEEKERIVESRAHCSLNHQFSCKGAACAYMYMRVCVHVCVCKCTYARAFAVVYVVSVYVCVCMYTSTCISWCVCVCVCACVVCLYECVYYVCLRACMHVYMYVHDSTCIAWSVELITRSVFRIKNLYCLTYPYKLRYVSFNFPFVHFRYVPFLRLIQFFENHRLQR